MGGGSMGTVLLYSKTMREEVAEGRWRRMGQEGRCWVYHGTVQNGG